MRNTVKNLQNNVVTPILKVAMADTTENNFGCTLYFSIECSDGVDVQLIEGFVLAVAVYASSAFTANTSPQSVSTVTGGTLDTPVFSWTTDGTIATLNVQVASSLTPTRMHINYFAEHVSEESYDYV